MIERRSFLKLELDRVELEKEPGWAEQLHEIWGRIDEIDRQVGVAYYWHATYPNTIPSLPPNEVEAWKRQPPALDT